MMGSHKDGEREEFHIHFMCYCKIPEININYITNKLSQILLTSKALPRKRNAFFCNELMFSDGISFLAVNIISFNLNCFT